MRSPPFPAGKFCTQLSTKIDIGYHGAGGYVHIPSIIFSNYLLDTLVFNQKTDSTSIYYVSKYYEYERMWMFYIERRPSIYIVSYLRRDSMKVGEFQHKLNFFLNKRQKHWFPLSSCNYFASSSTNLILSDAYVGVSIKTLLRDLKLCAT